MRFVNSVVVIGMSLVIIRLNSKSEKSVVGGVRCSGGCVKKKFW